MGTDWTRMRPRGGVARPHLLHVIEQQAQAFQANPCFLDTSIPCFHSDNPEVEQRYVDASRELRSMLEFPAYDDATDTPLDDPDLPVCWRVYPITKMRFFPPQWRMHAHRTFLPEQLPDHLRLWKEWAAAVAGGHHQGYLLGLYLSETTP